MSETPMPGLLRTLWVTLRISFRTHRGIAAGSLLLVPLGWLPGTLLAVWVKLLVDGVSARDTALIAAGTAGLIASRLGGSVAGAIGGRLRKTFEDRAGIELGEQLIRASAGRRGIEHLERPAYLDRIDPLRKEAWVVHWTLEALGEALGAAAQLALTVALLGGVDPVLLALPLFGVPSLLIARAAGLRERRAQEESGEVRRQQRHLLGLGTAAESGAEIRIFALAPALWRRFERSWRREHAIRVRAARVGAGWQAAGAAVFACGFLGAVGLVGVRVSHGTAGAGDLALTLVLARTLSGNLGLLVGMIQWLAACLGMGARFVWLRDEAVQDAASAGALAAPDRLRIGIELREVAFTYPGTARPVLRGVSVLLRPGEVVAVVGDNGAGKSSLVKLLCGLYEPTSGQILIDGVRLADIDPQAWRGRLSGAFQDHAKFQLTLGEAVGIAADANGAPDVASALARADAADLIDVLPAGLQTQLGRSWPGGVELSGGQWQKVALARALVRRAPLLTVLDEPTAGLDARTEDQLFSRYATEAHSAGITLLVSHRFSTVSAADRILVLQDGRIVEDGTHADLMRRGGEYAELYTLQARGYR